VAFIDHEILYATTIKAAQALLRKKATGYLKAKLTRGSWI
jgi:hypothetical protein